MGLLNVIAAGAAAWVFGAIWYTIMAKPWMKATGLTEEQVADRNPLPFIVSFISAIVVAGMTRHIMISSGATTLGGGVMIGSGLGLFIAWPWMINNVMFGRKDKALIWIDGVYVIGGSILIGIVLTIF